MIARCAWVCYLVGSHDVGGARYGVFRYSKTTIEHGRRSRRYTNWGGT